jgi:hypothetical protein
MDCTEIWKMPNVAQILPELKLLLHPAEPSLVVTPVEGVDLGDGHFDLLSGRHSRTTAELLMGFRVR